YLADRFRRLGIPFAVCAALLAPLAYIPTYLQSGGHRVNGFGSAWHGLPFWPAGPAWFLWVLLVLGALCAALTRITPRWGEALGRIAAKAERPATFFALLVAVSLVAYLPPALALDAGRWVSWGPFTVQASRPLLYAVFYFAGVGLGAHG